MQLRRPGALQCWCPTARQRLIQSLRLHPPNHCSSRGRGCRCRGWLTACTVSEDVRYWAYALFSVLTTLPVGMFSLQQLWLQFVHPPAAHHGSVGWRSTPLIRSVLWTSCFCSTTASSSRYEDGCASVYEIGCRTVWDSRTM